MEMVQALIPVFVVCFGLSQVFYGPASDRFGRRPLIALGMAIFLVGILVSMAANSVEVLLLGRALQGVGAGAAPVLARAILRDTHSGQELAKALSYTFAIFGVGIIIAPLLGFAVLTITGWRGVFAAIGIVSLGLLLFDILRYRETNREKDKDALALRIIWRSVRIIFGHPQSRYFTLCAMAAYCALLSYITNAPRLFATAFGVSGLQFSVFFAVTGIGIILGQFANQKLIPRFGILVAIRIASLILFLASGAILLSVQFGLESPVVFTALMFMFNTSFLVVVSNTAALTLNPHPKIAGITSSMFGLATNGGGAVFIIATLVPIGGDIGRWSFAMTCVTAICLVMIWCARRSSISMTD